MKIQQQQKWLQTFIVKLIYPSHLKEINFLWAFPKRKLLISPILYLREEEQFFKILFFQM